MQVPNSCLLGVLAATFALTACNDSGSSNNNPTPGGPGVTDPGVPALAVYGNGGDPRILKANYPTGPSVEYFGLRDANGLPTTLQSAMVMQGGGMTRIDLDDQARPDCFTTASGERYELEWAQDGLSATLIAISPDGSFQVTTGLDFGSGTGSPIVALGGERPTNIRSGRHVTSSVDFNPVYEGQPTTQFGTSVTGAVTSVSQCNVEAGSGLGMFTTLREMGTNDVIMTVPAYFLDQGLYGTDLPVSPVVLENNPANCQAIGSLMSHACTSLSLAGGANNVSNTLCVGLMAAIDQILTGPTTEAVYTFEDCDQLIAVLQLYCSTLALLGPGGSGTSMICDTPFENIVLPDEFMLQTCVQGQPGNVCSVPMSVTPNTQFPVQNSIDMGSDSAINSLTLNPSSPAVGQSYVATANMSCLPASSVVVLSIVGTDGYTDSETFNIAATQPQANFDLGVPGAAQGVQDTVTAQLTLPGGVVLERTAFLVFGL